MDGEGSPREPPAEPGAAGDEVALATRAAAGDTVAFGLLYERLAASLHDFLLRVVRDPAAAEDLTQQAWMRAFEGRSSLRDPARFRSWLFSIAHHAAMNHLSRGRPAQDLEERADLAAPGAGPEEQALAQDAARLVWSAAASLEPRQYAVLDLTVRRELTTAEVAETLGVPSSQAAVLVHRAREALGNAVRDLLVARRRGECPRLAELVPVAASFTPELRSTVDHHLRRCPTCRRIGVRVTRPAELLGGLALLPFPPALAVHGWTGVLAGLGSGAAASVGGAAAPPPPPPPPAPPVPGHPLSPRSGPRLPAHLRPRGLGLARVVAAGVAVAVIAGAIVVVARHPWTPALSALPLASPSVSGARPPSRPTPVPGASPQLYVSTAAVLGRLYPWPSFPTSIQLDTVDYLSHLAWSRQGSTASAPGDQDIDGCVPSCTAGDYTVTPIHLVASHPLTCDVEVVDPRTGVGSETLADVYASLVETIAGGVQHRFPVCAVPLPSASPSGSSGPSPGASPGPSAPPEPTCATGPIGQTLCVDPGTVAAGQPDTLSGHDPTGCSSLTLSSSAFPGGSVTAAETAGSFRVSVTVLAGTAAGRYPVTARGCGGNYGVAPVLVVS